ncbi:MAG: hypothetical protein GY803_30750, partial [Chloroflexi bacterium]|nr:hypothetical protein [Chloroflexota bacterium]
GDGRLLSSCRSHSDGYSSSDHTVKVWDIETGGLLHTLEGHTAGVDNLLLTGDGRLLSSCRSHSDGYSSSDHTVKVWDIEMGRLLHTLEGYISGIRFMVFLPIPGYLMTVGRTRLIIWQLDEARQVAGFTADGPIESYAITPKGRIALGDGLGRVHFLQLVEPK